MLRRVIYILLMLMVIGILGYICVVSLSSQGSMYPDRKDECIGVMPISQPNPIFVEAVPGIYFRFDTGSDISSITEEDLEKLRDMGAEIETRTYPTIGRDGEGKTRFNLKRYRVSLPLYLYDYEIDSLERRTSFPIEMSKNILHNVDFTPSRTGFSVLGTDFLEKFKVEYQYENAAIALYLERPAEYEDVIDLEVSSNPFEEVWLGHRYYSDITVDRKTDSYFLDTGLQYVQLKLPFSEQKRSYRKLKPAKVRTAFHLFDAMCDENAWMEVGDRSGGQKAYYYDSLEEEYAFNPLNLFSQDVLIDFEKPAIALKKFCTVTKSDFMLPTDSLQDLQPGANLMITTGK